MMNKYILSILFCWLSLPLCMAQKETPQQILSKAISSFKQDGGIEAQYTYRADGGSGRGSIQMQASKFRHQVDGQTIWFDGKTLWTLVKENEEVTVTQPTDSEIAKLNPYAFLSSAAKNYTAAFGTNTKSYYDLRLTPKQKVAGSEIRVRIQHSNYRPTQIVLGHASAGNITIDVTSYKVRQKYSGSTFMFSESKYPQYDVIDLR